MEKSELKTNNLNRPSGFSLLEVLVTALIIGIGLLAVATLQISSIASNQQAFYYTQASSIANELADRIRISKNTTMIARADRSSPTYADYINNYVSYDSVVCTEESANEESANEESANDDSGSNDSNILKKVAEMDLKDLCKVAKQTLPDANIRVVDNKRSVFALDKVFDSEGVQTGTRDTAIKHRLTILVDWASANARKDAGQKQNDKGNSAIVNEACNAWLTNGGISDRSCVMLSVVP